jgi:hypothetical protein
MRLLHNKTSGADFDWGTFARREARNGRRVRLNWAGLALYQILIRHLPVLPEMFMKS